MLRLFLPLVFVALTTIARAEPPAYFREALARFATDAPRGWAYTLTTKRDGETSVERFDPAKPAGKQWSLLQRNGHAPSAEDTDRYERYRQTMNSDRTPRATFERGDIDIGSVKLVREDATVAEFTCRFREDLKEAMLAHMELRLVVTKSAAHVEKYILRLVEPFAPIIGVKMNELEVTMTFAAPSGTQPGLPQQATSRFRGRLLLVKSIAEDSEVAYSDFVRSAPEANAK